MSSAYSMKARKCAHAQKPYSFSGIREWIKQGLRKKKKRGRETEASRLMKRKEAQQNKNLSKELKQGQPSQSSG